jgi:hypothetical protein
MHETEVDVTAQQGILIHFDNDLGDLAVSLHGVYVALELGGVLVRINHVKISSTEYFDVGCAAVTGHLRYGLYHDLVQYLQTWRLHHFLIYSFKVMYVADLTRLSDTTSMTESFPSVVSNGIHSIFGESREHQKAGNARPSTPLTRIAVDYHDFVLFGREEFVHFLTNFEQDVHGW